MQPKNWKSNFLRSLLLYGIILFPFSGNDSNAKEIIRPDRIITEKKASYPAQGGTEIIDIADGIDLNSMSVSVDNKAISWCKTEVKEGKLHIQLAPNGGKQRTTKLKLSANQTLKQELTITQSKYESVPIAKDIQVFATSAKATSQEPNLEIGKTIDGDYTTFFNSKFGEITKWPFNIDYFFENVENIDYIKYYPRQDGTNGWGAFGKIEVWVATKENPSLTKNSEYDLQESTITVAILALKQTVKNPTQIRIAVKSAFMRRVTCSEMEFYIKNTTNSFDSQSIFTDSSCSELKPGVTDDDIAKIPHAIYKDLATALKNGTYDGIEYRIQEYRPYQNPTMTRIFTKTMISYSLLGNATGIYSKKANEELVILVGDTHGQQVSVQVQDLEKGYGGPIYPLTEGYNVIKPDREGLLYLIINTKDEYPLIAKTDAEKELIKSKLIKINIVGGGVNGYFDIKKHDNKDWSKILMNAPYKEIDILGNHTHVIWITKHYRENRTKDIIKITENLDELLRLQHEMMGLYKYDKLMRNRMLFHIDYRRTNAMANTYRTAYGYQLGGSNFHELFTVPEKFKDRMWGPAHEVGHCNQLSPALNWTGMTEVSNNLFALYVQQQMGIPIKLEEENIYKKATDEIIKKGVAHCMSEQNLNYTRHIWKLVPFWQLHLYLSEVHGQNDFYKDLFEHYRTTDAIPTYIATDGVLQLDFVRNTCKISKINLLDFFKAWGFLTPVEVMVSGYGYREFIITQPQIDELVAEVEAMNLPKPDPTKPLVQTIRESNIKSFK